MVALVEAVLVWLVLVVSADPAGAQGMADLFGKVAGTVVVVQATARDGTEIGSGVLISPDGKIMTAAHLVHGADAVAVNFLGGRTCPLGWWPRSWRPTSPSSRSTRSPSAFGPPRWPTPTRSVWAIRSSWWARRTG